MNLKKATLFSLIGVSYIFISRTIGTFFPKIFLNLMVTRSILILSLCASITVVVFYIYFYRDYVQEEQITLKKASLFAIIGSCIGSFAALLLFLIYIPVFFIYMFSALRFLNIAAPWISSIFTLYFFSIFYKETIHTVQSKLKSALLLAVIGSSIAAVMRTFIIFNYFYSGKMQWFGHYSREFPVIFIPLFVFMFFTSFYFLMTFYKEQ